MLFKRPAFFVLILLLTACSNDSSTRCTTPDAIASNEADFSPNFYDVGASHWSEYFTYIESVTSQSHDPEKLTITKIASLPGENKFHGGVLAPDGDIYFIPSSSNKVYYLNTTTLQIKSFGDFENNNHAWNGGVLGPNGKIYSLPWTVSNNKILEIDPVTKKIETIEIASGGYGGQILAGNGKIYGIPDSATQIIEFDPIDKSITYFGDLPGVRKYFGGALAPNGDIYGIPLNATNVLRIDPDTRQAHTFGNLSDDRLKWAGGVLAPNGKIYAAPDDADTILVIDTNSDTIDTLAELSSDKQKWSFGVFAPNGLVYLIPDAGSEFMSIDYKTDEINYFGDYPELDKWNGAVIGFNGKFYTIPDTSSEVLEIDLCLQNNFHENILLSTYFNKY